MVFENGSIALADLVGLLLEKLVNFFTSISAPYMFLILMSMLSALIIVILSKVKEVSEWKNIYFYYY